MIDLSPEDLEALARQIPPDAWLLQARIEQLPPPGDWTTWLLLAGRGFGKSRTGAEWIHAQLSSGQAGWGALVAPTAADYRAVMIEGESGILAIARDGQRPIWEPSKRQLTWPNGAKAFCYSAEEPDRLRGPQHDIAWADELAAWKNVKEAWDMLQFGLRLGKRPRQLVTTTPRPLPIIRDLLKDPHCVVTRGSTYDNRANLAPSFFDQVIRQYEGTRLGRQELLGEVLDDIPGALWSHTMIEAGRVQQMPRMLRIVVAIDPAVTSGENSDETGIIVAGLGADKHGYVISDLSGRYTPAEWAARAVYALHQVKGDRIIGEANNGGDLIEHAIRTVDAKVPYKKVHASRGKLTRAEPIAALYEQNRCHHYKVLPELEDEMCGYDPAMPGQKSPNHMDALVWAFTELFFSGTSTLKGPVTQPVRLNWS